MKNISNSFSNNWNNVFNKDNSVFVESGTKAITEALTILNSKFVAIPTYTCERVLKATLDAGCKPYVTDCDYDLQINVDDLKDFKGDTVIVPHMFGIKAKVKEIKRMGFNVVEDCSQAMGFDDIGEYSDVVVSSTGGGCKWLSLGTRGELCGGGIVSYDGNTKINWWENYKFMDKSIQKSLSIKKNFKLRNEKAQELINAGVDLIGKDKPNAWMRAMYFTDNQKRIPYTPIHDLYGNFNCPIVDKYKNKLDWISIHI
tara:strand:- start:2441 stop:3211 length:771 start_codon:yes stop_codon:yes gene_type:complete